MAVNLSFNTPLSCTCYDVHTTGTVAANSTARVMIELHVTSTSTAAPRGTASFFYREQEFINATFTPVINGGTYSIAIVPKLHRSDTVTVSAAWSY